MFPLERDSFFRSRALPQVEVNEGLIGYPRIVRKVFEIADGALINSYCNGAFQLPCIRVSSCLCEVVLLSHGDSLSQYSDCSFLLAFRADMILMISSS